MTAVNSASGGRRVIAHMRNLEHLKSGWVWRGTGVRAFIRVADEEVYLSRFTTGPDGRGIYVEYIGFDENEHHRQVVCLVDPDQFCVPDGASYFAAYGRIRRALQRLLDERAVEGV